MIILDWDTLTICNFKCPYCYTRKNKTLLNKIQNKEEIDHIINCIKNTNNKFTINLLGGEPLLNPHLKYILDKLYELNNVEKIGIYTNSSKLIKFYNKKTVFHFSYHAIEANDDIIVKNMNFCIKNNIQCELNIIVINRKDKINNIIKIANKLNIKINFTYIYDNNKTYYLNINESQKCQLYSINNLFYYTVDEVINYKINKFTNYKCYQYIYSILVNGDVLSDCSVKSLFNIFNVKNLNNLKTFTICQKQYCDNECWWSYPKENNGIIFKDVSK